MATATRNKPEPLRRMRQHAGLRLKDMVESGMAEFGMNITACFRLEHEPPNKLAGKGREIQRWMEICGRDSTDVNYQELLIHTGNVPKVAASHTAVLAACAVIMEHASHGGRQLSLADLGRLAMRYVELEKKFAGRNQEA